MCKIFSHCGNVLFIYLSLLDGVRGLLLVFPLRDAAYLIDCLSEDGALIRLDRERAHVREVGGYQLGQLFYVDVLLLTTPFFIVAFVAGTNAVVSHCHCELQTNQLIKTEGTSRKHSDFVGKKS